MADFYEPSYWAQSVTPNRFRVLLLIATILVIFVSAYILYRYLNQKKKDITLYGPYTMTGIRKDPTVSPWSYLLNADQAAIMTSNNTTCGFFVYVEGASQTVNPLSPEDDHSRLQHVLTFGGSVGVKVDPIHQQVIVDIFEMNPAYTAVEAQQRTVLKSVVIKQVLNAKWNQIVFSIEGRTVDLYLNGVLSTSLWLDNLPVSELSGIWINESPDFKGQIALIQAWPERRTASAIMDNYQRRTDIRGKPKIPDPRLKISDLFSGFCATTGMCGFNLQPTPLEFIDYEFA